MSSLRLLRQTVAMPDDAQTPRNSDTPPEPESRAVREVADRYVLALADLDPILATTLGLRTGEDGLPDMSPAGHEATDALARATLAELDSVTAGRELTGDERRCARLLRERLEASLAMSEQGEHLRAISNILGPVQRVRSTFLDMPTATEDDWAVIARRIARVPLARAAGRAQGGRRGRGAVGRVDRRGGRQGLVRRVRPGR
jgi:uncharacterized protein (DUF885 family)